MRATIVFAAMLLGLARAQDAPLGACAAQCVDGVFNDPTRLQCAAGDLTCVCRATQNVEFGVTDCINQACGLAAAERDAQVAAAKVNVGQRCAAILGPAVPSTPVSTPPPASTPTPAPAPASSSSVPPPVVSSSQPAALPSSSSVAPAPVPSTPSSSVLAPTSTSVSAAAAASTQTSTGAASATTGASGSKTSSTQSQAAASATGSNSATEASSSEGGLSVAAKAGIGAGVGAVILIGGILACCLVMRRRKQENHSQAPLSPPRRPARSASPFSLKISNPMPGSGRHYASDAEKGYASVTSSPSYSVPRAAQRSPTSFMTHSGRSSNEDDLDRHARRYEDMTSGAQPRTMI